MARPEPSTPIDPLRLCVVVTTEDRERRAAAAAMAQALGIALFDQDQPPSDHDLALVQTGRRLELRVLGGAPSLAGGRATASELSAIDTTSGPGRSLGQPLLKAVGIKRRDPWRPRVLDATAGLGEDAWVLASVGCDVLAYERNPMTHALLVDGLLRAGTEEAQTAARMRVMPGDGIEVLQALAVADATDRPDVVYLDPMFPLGRKTAERKAMRVLRMLSGDDPDAPELLTAALRAATRRVVVKRPLRSPALQGPKPTVVHKGKSLRFDVYVTR